MENNFEFLVGFLGASATRLEYHCARLRALLLSSSANGALLEKEVSKTMNEITATLDVCSRLHGLIAERIRISSESGNAANPNPKP